MELIHTDAVSNTDGDFISRTKYINRIIKDNEKRENQKKQELKIAKGEGKETKNNMGLDTQRADGVDRVGSLNKSDVEKASVKDDILYQEDTSSHIEIAKDGNIDARQARDIRNIQHPIAIDPIAIGFATSD